MPPNSDNFNEDELIAPEWMNLEFFTKVLQKNGSTETADIMATSFEISPATEKGDHYASIMFRAQVQYLVNGISKEKSMIIKTMPEVEGVKMDFLKESYIFETEIGMYTEVLPRFERLLREAGDETVLAPPCIFHSLSPRKVIIFEDLVPLGYTVLRNRSITYDEVKLAYTKLAKWHAVSYKLIQEDPAFFEEYRHGLFSSDQWKEDPMFKNGLGFFVEFLQKEPSLSKYLKYFQNREKSIMDKAIESFNSFREKPRENFIYALNHGDFHLRNIMVKWDSESVSLEDLMLLDFQICYVGPVQNDLSYSFFMMLDKDLRPEKLDELTYVYHQVFAETLQKVGFDGKIPSLVDFRRQRLEDPYFEIFNATTLLPLWLKYQSGDVDMDRMMQCPEYQKSMYSNPDYVEEMQKLLPKYLHEGFLENL